MILIQRFTQTFYSHFLPVSGDYAIYKSYENSLISIGNHFRSLDFFYSFSTFRLKMANI